VTADGQFVTLTDQADAAWAESVERRTRSDAEVKQIVQRHVEKGMACMAIRLGSGAPREGWKPCRAVVDPLLSQVDLVHPLPHNGTPWGLRYVRAIETNDVGTVRSFSGAVVSTNPIHDYTERLVLIRPCPDDPEEWTEVGWDLQGLADLGGSLAQAVTPCRDHQLWAEGPGSLPDPDQF
jgi:hypothetical protein